MKFVALDAVPPGVVITILPVFAPLGTVAVTCVSELTVKLVAATPPNVTFVAWVRLTPKIVTTVPTGPLDGVKLLICGTTLNGALLARVPLGVTTLIRPVVAPAGTEVVMAVPVEFTVKVAAVPLKLTAVAPVRLVPKTVILAPTLPELVMDWTKEPEACGDAEDCAILIGFPTPVGSAVEVAVGGLKQVAAVRDGPSAHPS